MDSGWTNWILGTIAAMAAIFTLGIGVSQARIRRVVPSGKGPKWDNLPERNKALITELLRRARIAGLNVGFFDGWRSPTTQLTKMAAGKLKDPYNSYHVWGEAWDIVFKDAKGNWFWPDKTDPRWQVLGQIGESLGLTWGGRWSFFDGAHFQRKISMTAIRGLWSRNVDGYLRQQGISIVV